MFLPIGDDIERRKTPVVNYALIGLNLLVFVALCFPQPRPSVLAHYALFPEHVEWTRLLTAMFLHANLMHVLGNMLFLWIFGDNVEDRMGRVGYALFYLVTGLAAWGLHIATTEDPEIPALGASGAVSGTIGAFLVLYPWARIKMFVWIYFWTDVILVPAILWIGLWFLEQVYFSSMGLGGVAYTAHIGGFAAGAAIAGLVRLAEHLGAKKRPEPTSQIDAPRPAEPRRPFATVPEEEIEYLDDTFDRYSVVTLEDAGQRAEEVAAAAAGPAGVPAVEIARRLSATRGVVVRGIPRQAADEVRRTLVAKGVPSALVADLPGNAPSPAVPVHTASWDDRVLRLRVESQVIPLPWSMPFLFVGAAVNGVAFIDVFPGGRTAFRIPERPGVPLTRVDALRRSEETTDLAGLARSILDARGGAGMNEGIRVLAQSGALGWLAFRSQADYDDYLFWAYNLARFKG
jgi:membrane associated rhomboid family serine protease